MWKRELVFVLFKMVTNLPGVGVEEGLPPPPIIKSCCWCEWADKLFPIEELLLARLIVVTVVCPLEIDPPPLVPACNMSRGGDIGSDFIFTDAGEVAGGGGVLLEMAKCGKLKSFIKTFCLVMFQPELEFLMKK